MIPRLYLDEDVSPLAAALLRARGFDVISCHEVPLLGVADEAQIEFAAAQGRALLTFNHAHFSRIAAEWFENGRKHHGIVITYRQFGLDQLGRFSTAVATLLSALTEDELENTIRVLDDFL